MSELEKTEQFDNAKVSLIVDLDPLEPIGYIYRDGERFPILLVRSYFPFVRCREEDHINLMERLL